MSDVSVISIISNETVYKEWLQKSLDTQQGVVTEFIPVFNADNAEFDSARAALNYGASQAKGKYLLFAHQDIRFLEDDVIKKIYDYAESIDDFGVMGIAGAHGGGRESGLS